MNRTRRVAALATAVALTVAGGITAFALMASNANASGVAGGCSITASTLVGSSGHQECQIGSVTLTSPSLIVLSAQVPQAGHTIQFGWTSTCVKNSASLGTHSGSVTFTGTSGLAGLQKSAHVDPVSVAASPASCTVTAFAHAITPIANTEVATLTLSAFGNGPGPTGPTTVPHASGSGIAEPPPGEGSLTGPMRGFAGKCVDDPGNSFTPGTPVAEWRCNGGAAQVWTFADGELQHNNLCMSAGSNNAVTLQSCNGSSGQQWHFSWFHREVVQSSGLCLTNPGKWWVNGTHLVVAACKGTWNQRWTKP